MDSKFKDEEENPSSNANSLTISSNVALRSKKIGKAPQAAE